MRGYTCILTALLGATPLSGATDCLPLPGGRSVTTAAGPVGPCFTFTIKPGEAAEIVADQPVDLAFRLTANGKTATVDSFDFGPETVSIAAPGQYRLEVRPASSDIAASFVFTMSRKAVSLQEASIRHSAEDAATKAKISGKPDDIHSALDLWIEAGDLSAAGRTLTELGESEVASNDLPSALESFEKALSASPVRRRSPMCLCRRQ